MPTGDYGTITEYNLQQLKSDVMSDKLFGCVECDIRVLNTFQKCVQSSRISILMVPKIL
jgi:hypothetical protein